MDCTPKNCNSEAHENVNYSCFTDVLPDIFSRDSFTDDKLLPKTIDHVNLFDFEEILWLKDCDSPMMMKILHPKGFSNFFKAMTTQFTSDSAIDKLRICWNATTDCFYYASTISTLDTLRLALELNKCVLRFDIRRFYETFYTHILAWIEYGGRIEGKMHWKSGVQSWSNLIEEAILNLQYRESTGIPIGSKLIRELAESCLICIDAKFMTLIDQLDSDHIRIIRNHDNYDIIASDTNLCHKYTSKFVYLLREYGFVVKYEFTEPKSFHIVPTLQSLCVNGLEISSCNLNTIKSSMDYHLVLNHFTSTVLCTIDLSQTQYHKYLLDFITNHPACLHLIVNNAVKEGKFAILFDLLLPIVDKYVYQGVSCQFICLLELLRHSFTSDRLNNLETKIVHFHVKDHLLVKSYYKFYKLKCKPNTIFINGTNSNNILSFTMDGTSVSFSQDTCATKVADHFNIDVQSVEIVTFNRGSQIQVKLLGEEDFFIKIVMFHMDSLLS